MCPNHNYILGGQASPELPPSIHIAIFIALLLINQFFNNPLVTSPTYCRIYGVYLSSGCTTSMMHKQGFHACILIVLVFLIYKLQKNIKGPDLIELEK